MRVPDDPSGGPVSHLRGLVAPPEPHLDPEPRGSLRPPVPRPPRELDSQLAVTVVDLSDLGARLEHAEPLLPEQRVLLTLALSAGHRLCLPAQIVWTRAHHVVAGSPGAGWCYRSGVEFAAVSPPVTRDLEAYLERRAEGIPAAARMMALRGG